jgi:hypothetical protein
VIVKEKIQIAFEEANELMATLPKSIETARLASTFNLNFQLSTFNLQPSTLSC